MIYLVAKNKYKHGCCAFKTESGQNVVKIKRKLFEIGRNKGLQVVTISRPIAYGEYAPYHFVHSEEEFMRSAEELIK